MTNKNVIEIINRLLNPNADKIAYTASEVFTTIVHGYYYIRPGKKTLKFIDKIAKIISKDCKETFDKYFKTETDITFDERRWGKTVADVLDVARSMFDAEYYASQISKMVMDETYDESLLERYLYWLDEKELKSVFEGILTFKSSMDVFISDLSFDDMMEELKDCSMCVIRDNPWYMKNYDERVAYIDNNWDFCFEYLSRETIIGIICRYVNEDPVMLASMVKTFKYSDARTAAEFTGLAIYIEESYEMGVFNPTITDVEKIRMENYDCKHSEVICSNKMGKIMIV